jgi:hypothetical protein
MHVNMCVYEQACMCAFAFVQARVLVLESVRLCLCVCAHVCIHVCAYARVHVRVCVILIWEL